MTRKDLRTLLVFLLGIGAFVAGTVALAWVPLWQVAAYGYATWVWGAVGLLGLLIIAFGSGPTKFLAATLASVVLSAVLIFTGVWAFDDDAPQRVQQGELVALPQPQDTVLGYLYPGWWHGDVRVARNVRGTERIKTTLQQNGEQNRLTVNAAWEWPAEVYRADLLAGVEADYKKITKAELQEAVREVVSRYNENRPFTEAELYTLGQDVQAVFCSHIIQTREEGFTCPSLQVNLTYERGGETYTLATH